MVNNEGPTSELTKISCSKLRDYPLRGEYYDQVYLDHLCISIGETGLLDSLLVRPEGSTYQILSGHYRLRAVNRLNWPEVSCRVKTCSQQDGLLIYCTSNIYTRVLTAIEESQLINILMVEGGLTLSQAGALFGRGKSWASRRIQLLNKLEPALKEKVTLGQLKPRIAQELARLPQGNDQKRVLSVIRKQALTKDEAAELVSRWLKATPEEKNNLEADAKEEPDANLRVISSLRRLTRLLDETIKNICVVKGSGWLSEQLYHSFNQKVLLLQKILGGDKHEVLSGKGGKTSL